MSGYCERYMVRVAVTGLHTGSAKAMDPMPVGILNVGKGPRSSDCFFRDCFRDRDPICIC